MPAFLELHLKGNGRAYVEVGMIGAVVTGADTDIHTPGTATKPVLVVLRGVGDDLEVVGESAGKILARAQVAREALRGGMADGLPRDFLIDYLKPLADDDAA